MSQRSQRLPSAVTSAFQVPVRLPTECCVLLSEPGSAVSLLVPATFSFISLLFILFHSSHISSILSFRSLPGYLSPPSLSPWVCIPALCWCYGSCGTVEGCSRQKTAAGEHCPRSCLGGAGGGCRGRGKCGCRVGASSPALPSATNFSCLHSASEPTFPHQ